MVFEQNMTPVGTQQNILWRQVWGVAALLGVILFSFMAYGLYQPIILNNLGFTGLAAWLGIAQGFLGAVLEPLVGGASDRILRRFGSRLPMISIGTTIAALIFVILGLVVEGNLPTGLRWLIPVMMTIWVMAMIIFRGPAIALLIQFAPLEKLPQAGGIIVLVMGLVGALGPVMNISLKTAGASITFILGAIALVLGATYLFSTIPRHTLILPPAERRSPGSIFLLGAIFLTGLGAGIEINLLFSILPAMTASQWGGRIAPELVTSAILLISAIAALPLARFTAKLGVVLAMGVSLGAIALFILLILALPNSVFGVIFTLGISIALGGIFINQIPFCLSRVPPIHAGLGTGLYFGGMGAATAIVSLLMKSTPVMTPGMAVLGIAIAWIATIPCLVTSSRLAPAK
jgi:hypothetical protein